jgi:ubiquinone/menaquinone biosynthesis C-methylase UbiE
MLAAPQAKPIQKHKRKRHQMDTDQSNSTSAQGRGEAGAYGVAELQNLYEQSYGQSNIRDWEFHDTADPILRYLRDRRLEVAINALCKKTGQQPKDWTALVVCGGVGGEGTYLANRGFRSVVVSDFSSRALDICKSRDPRLGTLQLNAEALDVPDNSYDVVLVQDGLHELRRPVLGLTEMMRVARRAVLMLEPHAGVVAGMIGTMWESHEVGEKHDGAAAGAAVKEDVAENYVFRWNTQFFRDVTRSYLLKQATEIAVIRFWDHNVTMRRLAQLAGGGRLGLSVAKAAYRTLDTGMWWMGNAMVGIVIKAPVGTSGGR